MFLKYGGSNFYCFKDDFEIDLRLNNNCPKSISQGNDFTKVICIKGANGAGKTSALKALAIICEFAQNSFSYKPNHTIPIESYFGNSDPIYLYCEFRIKDTDYRYELTVTPEKVLSEELIELSGKNKTLILRANGHLQHFDKDYEDILEIPQLRENASFISLANQHQVASLEKFYLFFTLTISNVRTSAFEDLFYDNIHEYYHETPEALDFVKKQISRFDTGVEDIIIDEFTNVEGEIIYHPVFNFLVDGEIKGLRLSQQSQGTKRLYQLLGFIYTVLMRKEGGLSTTLIIDELDLHLHSEILPELTALFEDSDNSQIIFSCQNDQIMDTLGKYRIALINKEENQSYTYRLDDLPSDLLRNGRPVTTHYKNHSIGGFPNIG